MKEPSRASVVTPVAHRAPSPGFAGYSPDVAGERLGHQTRNSLVRPCQRSGRPDSPNPRSLTLLTRALHTEGSARLSRNSTSAGTAVSL